MIYKLFLSLKIRRVKKSLQGIWENLASTVLTLRYTPQNITRLRSNPWKVGCREINLSSKGEGCHMVTENVGKPIKIQRRPRQ